MFVACVTAEIGSSGYLLRAPGKLKCKGNNLSLLPHSLLHRSGYECPSSVTLARSQGDTAPRPTLPLWFTGEKHCLPNWVSFFFFFSVLFEKTQLCWNFIRGWEKWCFSSFSPLTCSVPKQSSARLAEAGGRHSGIAGSSHTFAGMIKQGRCLYKAAGILSRSKCSLSLFLSVSLYFV